MQLPNPKSNGDENDLDADIHTGIVNVHGVPVIAIQHPAADPKHPDHASFLKRLAVALGTAAFDTGVFAITGGVLRVGIYAHDDEPRRLPEMSAQQKLIAAGIALAVLLAIMGMCLVGWVLTGND